LGGSTIVSGQGFQPVRCFKQPGSSVGGGVGPERERLKRLKREQDKEARDRIKANEKLIKKLANSWREEAGRRLFEKLSAERSKHRRLEISDKAAEPAEGKALAIALQAALAKRHADKA
jgi:hypothetical protein